MLDILTHEAFAQAINKNPRTIYNILTSSLDKDRPRKEALPPFRKIACNRYVVSVADFEAWLAKQPVINHTARTPARIIF